jgi:hypothetical protein
MTAEFIRLLHAYDGAKDPAFRVRVLETAIPRGAEQWPPMDASQLRLRVRRRGGWLRRLFPVTRRDGVVNVGAMCAGDPRSVVQVIDGLHSGLELVATCDLFVTIFDADGYRLDMQYLRRGDVLEHARGLVSAYILNVAIGATDPGGAGVPLSANGAEL